MFFDMSIKNARKHKITAFAGVSGLSRKLWPCRRPYFSTFSMWMPGFF